MKAERRIGAFILTHGRPDKVPTYKKLMDSNWSGPVYFIVDNEDKTVDRYRANFGEDRVIVFDKKAMADEVDEGNNFDDRRVILHARNVSFKIARFLGLTHFIQLDDDYNSFLYRWSTPGTEPNEHGIYPSESKPIKAMDRVLEYLCEFLDSTGALTIAISQGGDHIGGFGGLRLHRKAMNSFICSTARPFTFLGSINEDVNTYVLQGSRGEMFFTYTGLQLNQEQTQKNTGGMSDIYAARGTYVKSFHTVMMHPSSVKVAMMGPVSPRLHHVVDWSKTVPKIIPDIYRAGRNTF